MDQEGDIITIKLFLEYLTYFLKLSVHVNKGIDNERVLNKLILLYNKFKVIESAKEHSDSDEKSVRIVLKRLNLSLKVTKKNNPIDINDKSNQTKILSLKEHPAIMNDNLDAMITYANNNKTEILQGIPLWLVIREGKYQRLLWQYVRILFLISQMIIANPYGPEKDTLKTKVYDDSLVVFANVLEKIESLESSLKTDQILELDDFCKIKLVKVESEDVGIAMEEIQSIFEKRGLAKNRTMRKLMDKITSKIPQVTTADGNIASNIIGIGKSVADEIIPELQDNPDDVREILEVLPEIFSDLLSHEALQDTSKMPKELRSALEMVKGLIGNNAYSKDNESGGESIMLALEDFAKANGISKDEFFKMIIDDNGVISHTKLEQTIDMINKGKK